MPRSLLLIKLRENVIEQKLENGEIIKPFSKKNIFFKFLEHEQFKLLLLRKPIVHY